MKIIRFASASSRGPEFGVVIHDHAVSFSALQHATGRRHPELADGRRYLSGLPGSEQAARELTAWGEQHLDELEPAARHPLGAVRLLDRQPSRWPVRSSLLAYTDTPAGGA